MKVEVNDIMTIKDILSFKTIDEFLNKVNDLEIENILLDGELIVGDKSLYFNSEDSPIAYIDKIYCRKALSISSEYYKNNKDIIDQAIAHIVQNVKGETIRIKSTNLINDSLLYIIKDNPNLKRIYLGDEDDTYEFNEKIYMIYKDTDKSINTTSVSEAFKENFEKVVGNNYYRKLVREYDYNQLRIMSDLYIYNPLSSEEISNLKYLNSEAEVTINIADSNNIFDIVTALQRHNPNIKITIQLEKVNKNEFNKILFANKSIIDTPITIKRKNSQLLSLKEYYEYEMTLSRMVEPAQGLSPYEKYLYAYNIVKQIKQYAESSNRRDARDLYLILKSNYIVCAGFTNLLKDLLDKLGIQSLDYGVSVNTGFDKVPNQDVVLNDDIEVYKESHARLFVNLVDEKYNIDGIYVADPTWDNDLQNDYYNHALMTATEATATDRYNFYKPYAIDEVFFSQDQENFYQHLNNYVNRQRKDNILTTPRNVLTSLLNLMKELNEEKYEELSQGIRSISEDEVYRRIESIANYIISRNNKPIGIDKIKPALEVLYSNFYGYESKSQVDEAVAKTILLNAERQAEYFPKRYKINQDGSEEVYMDETEKFGPIQK